MKHVLYEDPMTHKCALIRIPRKFSDGDPISIRSTDRWFGSREEAMAALAELLNREEEP